MAQSANPFTGMKSKSSSSRLFNRVGHVELDFGTDSSPSSKGLFAFKGLDFKFRIRQICAEYPKGFAQIAILGLSPAQIDQITELTTQNVARDHKKRVRVFAGYAKEDDPDYDGDLVCDLDIMYATPTTMPPEVWLTITAGVRLPDKDTYMPINLPKENERQMTATEYVYENNVWGGAITASRRKVVKTVQKKYLFEDLMKDVVKTINETYKKAAEDGESPTYDLELEWRAPDYYKKLPVPTGQFVSDGTVSDLFKKLNKLDNLGRLRFFIDNRIGEKKDFLVVEEITSKEEDKMVTRRLIELDINHGLIGLPSLVQGNCLRCKSLLIPELRMMDWVKMTSILAPKMNGYWKVREVTHTGHFRGNEWYTDIVANDPTKMNMGGDARKE